MKRLHILAIFVVSMISVLVLWQIVQIRQQRDEERSALVHFQTLILEQAPCIDEICVNSQGFSQSLQQLNSLDYLDVVVGGEGGIRLDFLFVEQEIQQNIGYGAAWFVLNNDNEPLWVDKLSISFHDLTLETALSILGEPETFLFVSGCGMGDRVFATLLYPNRGMMINIEYQARQPDRQQLNVETPINRIDYFAPEGIDSYIIEVIDDFVTSSTAYALDESLGAEDMLSQLQPWTGLDANLQPSADYCPR